MTYDENATGVDVREAEQGDIVEVEILTHLKFTSAMNMNWESSDLLHDLQSTIVQRPLFQARIECTWEVLHIFMRSTWENRAKISTTEYYGSVRDYLRFQDSEG